MTLCSILICNQLQNKFDKLKKQGILNLYLKRTTIVTEDTIMSTLQRVMTKARKRWGTEYPATPTDYEVELLPGKSISIFKNGVLGTSFAIGSIAEYDSYNLSYMGTITKITAKTVQIKERYSECLHNLDLNEFCWRNYNFDVDVATAENSDTMMSI